MAKKQMVISSVPDVFFDKWKICDGDIDEAISALQQIKVLAENQGFSWIKLVLGASDLDYFDVYITGTRLETDKEAETRIKRVKKARERTAKARERAIKAQKVQLRKLLLKYPDVR